MAKQKMYTEKQVRELKDRLFREHQHELIKAKTNAYITGRFNGAESITRELVRVLKLDERYVRRD